MNSSNFYAGNAICFYCKTGNADYLTSCEHAFHLNCLTYRYHYSQICPECEGRLYLPFVSIIDTTNCSKCKSTKQLQNLECHHKYCISCILGNKIEFSCCKNARTDWMSIKIQCPTCEEISEIHNFAPVECPNDGALCKKCYNLSFMNRACIGGCGYKFQLALVENCFGCSKESVIFYSNQKCSSGCAICFDCRIWYLLNYGQSNKCYICSSVMN